MHSNASTVRPVPQDYDIYTQLNATDLSIVIFKPSIKLEALLYNNIGLLENIINLLADSKVLYVSA